MFGTIRKHQNWLWGVIITVIIITFVVYFSPYSKMNTGRGDTNFGSVDGHKITQNEYVRANQEAELHYFFNTGRFHEDEKNSRFDPMQQTYFWLLLIQKEQEAGIHVSDEAMQQTAWELARRLDRPGAPGTPAMVVDLLRRRGRDESFEGFVRHYAGLQQMISTYGVGGTLVTPEQAKLLYARDHTDVVTEVALFSASNYLASVTVKPEELTQFYSNRLSIYRIPERMQVSYVKFNVTNFLTQAETDLKTNLTELVEENFKRLGTNAAVVFPEAKTPDEVKAKIREKLVRNTGMVAAQKKSLSFATTLFEKQPLRPENLSELAKTNGLEVQVSAPFDRENGPKDLQVAEDFTKAAFSMTDEEPVAGPLVGEDGFYLIALNTRIPSKLPSFDEIKDKVTADYKQFLAMTMAHDSAKVFDQALTNGLAQGKTFAAVAEQQKVKTLDLPPFSISTQTLPQVEGLMPLDQFKQVAFSFAPGKSSGVIPTRQGAMVLYVKSKSPVDEAKMQADMPNFLGFVRRRMQDEAFNTWFNREAEKGLRDTPLAQRAQQQQRPPPTMGPGKAKS
jgi:parvulin-like peptidyl-prolyl isomerase